MITTAFLSQPASPLPIYRQLADYFKEQINLGHLPAHSRLPSIRKLAAALSLSRTTIETAYEVLVAEGYIASQPQKGFLVLELINSPRLNPTLTAQSAVNPIRYNFANNYIDSSSLDTKLWRRCINNTLKNPAAIASYGEAQGELFLRTTLAKYSYEARGVLASPQQIVIGAGVQSLLEILIGILQPAHHRLALEAPGFPQAEKIFADHNWEVETFQLEALHEQLPQLLLVSPSNPYKGHLMTTEERLALLRWSKKTGGLILEDDYNGEFRYFARPISALQGMAGGENIIYLGSFSRLVMPALRISYLVLPLQLVERYQQTAQLYNQTSSTIEQLALAEFIAGGHLRRHVRKLRKIYAQKNELLRAALLSTFGEQISIRDYTSGLHLRLAVHTLATAETLTAQALAAGLKILPVHQTAAPTNSQTSPPEILLSFVGIDEKDIVPAIKSLKQAWHM